MAIINEDYVSFEVAKLLKEKGFPQSTFRCHYIIDGNTNYKSFENRCGFGDYDIIAPTLQIAMKWLREVHNIVIIIIPSVLQSDNLKWITSIRTFNKEEYYLEEQGIVGKYNTYEEAAENAIKYCLENLI